MEFKFLTLLLVSLASIILLPGWSGEVAEDSEDVDIDSYIVIKIEFSSGDSMNVDAEISASGDPVTIFMIKGDDDFDQWKETEEVDIQAIMAGENVTDSSDEFRVIENFSMKNTTQFSGSISLGDRDNYYLVIVIHREEGMSKEDILSRGSRVSYNVEWKTEEKELNYWLLAIAAFIGLIGIGLIVFYFKDRNEREEEVVEPEPISRRTPPPRVRREPPSGSRMGRRPPPER